MIAPRQQPLPIFLLVLLIIIQSCDTAPTLRESNRQVSNHSHLLSSSKVPISESSSAHHNFDINDYLNLEEPQSTADIEFSVLESSTLPFTAKYEDEKPPHHPSLAAGMPSSINRVRRRPFHPMFFAKKEKSPFSLPMSALGAAMRSGEPSGDIVMIPTPTLPSPTSTENLQTQWPKKVRSQRYKNYSLPAHEEFGTQSSASAGRQQAASLEADISPLNTPSRKRSQRLIERGKQKNKRSKQSQESKLIPTQNNKAQHGQRSAFWKSIPLGDRKRIRQILRPVLQKGSKRPGTDLDRADRIMTPSLLKLLLSNSPNNVAEGVRQAEQASAIWRGKELQPWMTGLAAEDRPKLVKKLADALGVGDNYVYDLMKSKWNTPEDARCIASATPQQLKMFLHPHWEQVRSNKRRGRPYAS